MGDSALTCTRSLAGKLTQEPPKGGVTKAAGIADVIARTVLGQRMRYET